MGFGDLITEALFFLILINPISKIVLVNMLPDKIQKEDINKIIVKSSIIAFFLLMLFAFAGSFILQDIFKIDILALQFAGGIVLAIIGFRSLDKGTMFNIKVKDNLLDLAIVPLASPLIAGPATITAVILEASKISAWFVTIALFIAISINMLLSLSSLKIKNFLDKYNLLGALIRITGLFIMAMGSYMILDVLKTIL